MSKQQTAVEWLVDNLQVILPKSEFNDVVLQDVIGLIKKMEKQQIIDAYNEGACHWDSEEEGEQYYNKTFSIGEEK